MTEAPIDRSREKVRALLWDACELEHQLMLQYLFAAFTLKKFPDATCDEAQLEAVRRWTSTIMVVARQEMEHLALANGMLAAIGEDPFFARDNIPARTRYFVGEHQPRARKGPAPLDIPFLWERFNEETISRFVCAESPGWKDVQGTDMYPAWCFADPDAARANGLGGGGLPLSRSHVEALPAEVNEAAPRRGKRSPLDDVPVHPGTIPELYGHIDRLLHNHPQWFTGVPDRQVFIPVEYQISVIKITDPHSAHAAIDQIIEEGEGIDAPPGYQSHFARFWRVREELLQLMASTRRRGVKSRAFDPSLPVETNPVPERGWPAYTREVSDLLDYAYETLLYVLTSLYRNYHPASRPPYLTAALQNVAFGPFMTMVIRPVSEVLVHLRVDRDGHRTAGPVFRLSDEAERVIWPRPWPGGIERPGEKPVAGPPGGKLRLPERARIAAQLDDINFILARMDRISERARELSAENPRGDHAGVAGLRAALVDAAPLEWAHGQLRYVSESAEAMANNVRRIYQIGQLPQFNVPVEWPR